MNLFLPQGGIYYSWPLLTDIFPWQHSGAQMKRTSVIAQDAHSLIQRWTTFVKAEKKRDIYSSWRLRQTTTSKVKDNNGAPLRLLMLLRIAIPSPPPSDMRSVLNCQWVPADNRLEDYLRPALWNIQGPRQVYMTSLLSTVLGYGTDPATVSALVPDLHHYNGRGGKDVVPLWRDKSATQPNIASGILKSLVIHWVLRLNQRICSHIATPF